MMPVLIEALGPDVVPNLARTASLVADDMTALDQYAAAAAATMTDVEQSLDVRALAELRQAVRTRVLRSWALQAGVPGSALSAKHLQTLDALVTHWHGQGPIALPGGKWAVRQKGRIRLVTAPPPPSLGRAPMRSDHRDRAG
jgi:tRNA(Ile)-lysidine synthase